MRAPHGKGALHRGRHLHLSSRKRAGRAKALTAFRTGLHRSGAFVPTGRVSTRTGDGLSRWHGASPVFRVELHGISIFFALAFAARLRAFGLFRTRSEEHTSELQSLMRISYGFFCLKQTTN